MELADIAQRAVESALTAGAGNAEAYVQDSVGREIRVFDGEVESLTDAGQRGLGVRCWIDHRSGYAYGTDLSDEGLRGIAAGAVEGARIADPDEFAAAPQAADGEAPEIPGLVDASLAKWTTERKVELAQAIELAAFSMPAAAQYPNKVITVVVPFAAGGPTDVVTRMMGEHISRTLGQQLVVENVAGAGGTTGMTRVAEATPDGYTIGVGNTGTQ